MEKLRKYLDDYGLRYNKFAERIGLNHKSFSLALTGKRKIPKKYWKNIVEETKGEISLNDLLEYYLKDEKNEK